MTNNKKVSGGAPMKNKKGSGGAPMKNKKVSGGAPRKVSGGPPTNRKKSSGGATMSMKKKKVSGGAPLVVTFSDENLNDQEFGCFDYTWFFEHPKHRRPFIKKTYLLLTLQLFLMCGFVASLFFIDYVKELVIVYNGWAYAAVGVYILCGLSALVIDRCMKPPFNSALWFLVTVSATYNLGTFTNYFGNHLEIIVVTAVTMVVLLFLALVASRKKECTFGDDYVYAVGIQVFFLILSALYLVKTYDWRFSKFVVAFGGSVMMSLFMFVSLHMLMSNEDIQIQPNAHVFAATVIVLLPGLLFMVIVQVKKRFGKSPTKPLHF